MKRFQWTLLLVFLALAQPVLAQIITGAITGTVTDPSGSRVPDAAVTITNAIDKLERKATTNTNGDFVITGLDGGQYDLRVAKQGFSAQEQKGINLITGQRLALNQITLQVGSMTEVISVTAQAAIVQTQSSEHSATVTTSQLEGLAVASRMVSSLIYLLPGVVNAGDSQYLNRGFRFNVQGGRTDTNTVMVDGILSTDIDDGGNLKLQTSQDAVGEVQVLLTNYQAEYGRMGGAVIQSVTKSGTPRFHGLGSYFMRREWMNAMTFFDNRSGAQKPRYRYNTITGNIGGPVSFGSFNRNHDKLFFFYNQEYWPVKTPMTGRLTMPTDLEKIGDFSQSLDAGGRMVVIRDPFNNNTPFPLNAIPPQQKNASGAALLKMFRYPPNFFDRTISGGSYNYLYSEVLNNPNRVETVKIDYNINATNTLVGSYNGFRELEQGPAGGYWLGNWPQQMKTFFRAGNKGAMLRYTRIISPSMVNEAQFSWFANPETAGAMTDQDWQGQLRKNTGFNVPMISAQANLEGVMPAASFGGVTGAASLRISGRIPVNSPYNLYTWNDKFTWVRSNHTFKAGLTVERFWRDIEPESTQYGSFAFNGANANNPLNTGYAYANAYLGVFDSYVEDSRKSWQRSRGGTVDFFVQDTWKVSSRLTLDYGMRFYYFVPTFTKDDAIAGWVQSYYKAADQVRLIRPTMSGGKRVGVDPVTGTLYPNAAIAAIVPNVGNPANGMVDVSKHPEYPRAMFKAHGVQWGPRIGFAYDPFGSGKTAIRGGFGAFYNPLTTNKWRNLSTMPPQVWQPNVYFGQLSSLASLQSLYTPITAVSVDAQGLIPMVMNFSLGVQQNIGFGTVLEVSYVGSLGRHLSWQRDLNYIPMGARFLSSNLDSTTNKVLDDKFLRPLAGYNNINYMEMGATSNYHSMQVTVNRRFNKTFQLGGSWTWSKAMDFVDSDQSNIAVAIPMRSWNYGMAGFDRTHVMKINYQWNLPGSPWENPIAKRILNDWQLSGISSFQSGAPSGIGFSDTSGKDYTGTPSQSARIDLTGNPVLPVGQRTFFKNFNTDVLKLPAVGTVGNSSRTVIRQPFTTMWDMAMFKEIPLRESVRMTLRWEVYNVFNHPSFSAFNASPQYNAAGVQINSLLGQYTSTLNARRMQLGARLSF
jgi:hypothetical protein